MVIYVESQERDVAFAGQLLDISTIPEALEVGDLRATGTDAAVMVGTLLHMKLKVS